MSATIAEQKLRMKKKEMKMKTIKEIVREMRSVAGNAERIHLYDLRKWGSDSLRAYADLIEEAHKRELAEAVAAKREACDQVAVSKTETTTATCKESLQVGNAMVMREALEELIANIEMRSSTFGLNVMVDTKTFLDAKAALSAPARNCNRFDNIKDAKEAFCLEVERIYLWDGYCSERLIKWLFAEAKGDVK
jgi:hypothetical protein